MSEQSRTGTKRRQHEHIDNRSDKKRETNEQATTKRHLRKRTRESGTAGGTISGEDSDKRLKTNETE